jgi:hypothetical protein
MEVILWMIVVASSIWVLVDAKSIGVQKGQIKGMGDIGPWGWFFVCLLFWIIGFPFYLAKRGEYKRINGKGDGSAVTTVIGSVLIAVQVAVIIMLFTGDIKMRTSDLQDEVRKNIAESWAKEPALANAKILAFRLIHKTGNQYEGLLEASALGVTEKLVVDVTYDGKQFLWQVRR